MLLVVAGIPGGVVLGLLTGSARPGASAQTRAGGRTRTTTRAGRTGGSSERKSRTAAA